MLTQCEYSETVRNMRRGIRRLDREGDYWSEDDKEKLRILFDLGTGITDISIQMQRTEPAIMQQIEKLDLYQRKENPSRRRFGNKDHCTVCSCEGRDHIVCPNCGASLIIQEDGKC